MQLWLRIPLEKNDDDDDAMNGNSDRSAFLTNAKGFPCLSKRHQKLIDGLFHHSIQIVVCGKPAHNISADSLESVPTNYSNNHVDDIARHPLRSYVDYVAYLYQRMDPLPEQERFEVTGISYSLLCNLSWII